MKVLVVGDPHGDVNKLKRIPKKGIDLILVTGDLGKADLMRKMAFENIERKKKGLKEKDFSSREKKRVFMEAYNSSVKVVKYLSKFSPVYTIYGNVENNNSETKKYSKKIKLTLPLLTNNLNKIKGVKVINNKLINFKGIRIGGLEYFVDDNWVKEFKPSDYSKKLKKATRETKKAGSVLKKFGRVDILIHHQPPYGYLDKVGKMAPKHWQGKHAGSKLILNYIKTKKPKYAFCGHIHECEGHAKMGKTEVYNLGVGGWKVIDL